MPRANIFNGFRRALPPRSDLRRVRVSNHWDAAHHDTELVVRQRIVGEGDSVTRTSGLVGVETYGVNRLNSEFDFDVLLWLEPQDAIDWARAIHDRAVEALGEY